MRRTVFYAWESSLPEITHRKLIEACLEEACKNPQELCPDVHELLLDQDTQGMPGSPDMAAAILEKINRCDVFVADVSMTKAETSKGRRNTPNPNVMFELGYAMALHTWDRILMILDTGSGTPDDLPFDFRHHRVVTYSLRTGEAGIDYARVTLGTDLRASLGAVLNGNLRLLAHQLSRLLEEVDSKTMDSFRLGAMSATIYVQMFYVPRLKEIMKDSEFPKLATFEQEGKSIGKPDLGMVNTYKVTITKKFVEFIR